jgi:hypothetical protein
VNPETILIPLSYLVAVGTPVISALVAAIVWLAKAKDRAEQGRHEDLRAHGIDARALLERAIAVVERNNHELAARNERARRRQMAREGDSDPPASREDTATRLRRIAADIEGGNPGKDPTS